MSCCNRPNRCQNRRDCPARIERIRLGRKMLNRGKFRIHFLRLAYLSLASSILLAILAGLMYHNAWMPMACTTI